MSKLKEGLKEYQRRVKAGEVKRAKPQNPREKWEEDKTNRKKSINAMCWDCIGESREEIRNCSASKTCPLWHVRPYQKKEAK